MPASACACRPSCAIVGSARRCADGSWSVSATSVLDCARIAAPVLVAYIAVVLAAMATAALVSAVVEIALRRVVVTAGTVLVGIVVDV